MIRLPSSSQLTFAVLALFLSPLFANAAENYLPPIGGTGGGQFIAPCPAGQNLAGFELRAGDDIDAIHPLCVSAYSTGSVTAPQLTEGSGFLDNVTGQPTNSGFVKLPYDWHGGIGGGRASVVCPHDRPIVVAMYVAAEGVHTVTVNNIHLFCGLALPSQQLDPNPTAIFDAPKASGSPGVLGIGGTEVSNTGAFQRCPEGQVAVGVHGRSGEWLDAMGLICDAPRVAQATALGRVQPSDTQRPTMTICEAAKSARARNSPAAPGLEKQCAAQPQTVAPGAVHLGRVEGTSPGTAPPMSICDAAISAHARNSPAAPGLEKQCRALGGGPALDHAFGKASTDELAAKGEAIVSADPLLSALRELQPEDANRRGFNVGVAACGTDTAWGPGKQSILASLAPAEQEGFKVATSFALDRNRNDKLAAVGARIDVADPELAQARASEADSRYALGFDIATGIFGDPKLEALGNTLIGPGSLGIRDALSAPAQRGFNASVKIHLARDYRR